MWLKYKLRLLSYIQFYAQKLCQMQKTRIEVKADIIIYANAWDIAWLADDNWYDTIIDLVDSDSDDEVNFLNIKLVKFGV